MPCRSLPLPGGVAIVCSRGPRRKTCSVGGCGRAADHLCDAPVERAGKSATCDADLCVQHAFTQSPGVDFCPSHDAEARRSRSEVPS